MCTYCRKGVQPLSLLGFWRKVATIFSSYKSRSSECPFHRLTCNLRAIFSLVSLSAFRQELRASVHLQMGTATACLAIL